MAAQETPAERQARWFAGCQGGNLMHLANASDARIKELEDKFGPINFDARVHGEALYQRYDGRDFIPDNDMILDMVENIPEKIARVGSLLHDKYESIEESEIHELIFAGQDLARYQITHPVTYMTVLGGSWEEAAGSFVKRWRTAVYAAADARKPNQRHLALISDDVSDQDWDRLFALYLKMEEIRLANPQAEWLT